MGNASKVIAIVAILIFNHQSASGDVTSFSGTHDIIGAMGVFPMENPNFELTQRIDLKITNNVPGQLPNVVFNNVSYAFPQIIVTETQQLLVVGTFDQFVDITFNLEVDSFVITGSSAQAYDLALRSDGNFDLDPQVMSDILDNTTFSGSWSIQGPTEMASGSFNQEVVFRDDRRVYYALDVSNFPESVDVLNTDRVGITSGSLEILPEGSNTLYDGLVDGAEVELRVGSLFAERFGSFTVEVVPEPSTFSMFCFTAIAVACRRSRRRFH